MCASLDFRRAATPGTQLGRNLRGVEGVSHARSREPKDVQGKRLISAKVLIQRFWATKIPTRLGPTGNSKAVV